MAEDLYISGNILLAELDMMWTFQPNDESTLQLLAKLEYSGPTEISAFYQLNRSSVVVADEQYDCLMIFNRDLNKFSHYSGICEKRLSRVLTNGDKDKAQFSTIADIIRGEGDDYSQKLIVADFGNKAVRHVDLVTQAVGTIYQDDDLGECSSLCWEADSNSILVGSYLNVKRLSIGGDTSVTVLAGNDEESTRDGTFTDASFLKIRRIIHILDDLYVITTDFGTRVANTTSEMVYSICKHNDQQTIIEGNATECETRGSQAVTFYNGYLYFGVHGPYWAVGRIPGKIGKCYSYSR